MYLLKDGALSVHPVYYTFHKYLRSSPTATNNKNMDRFPGIECLRANGSIGGTRLDVLHDSELTASDELEAENIWLDATATPC